MLTQPACTPVNPPTGCHGVTTGPVPSTTDGTLTYTVPSTWSITQATAADPAMTCVLTSTSVATCVITDPQPLTLYGVSLTVTGPADDHTSTFAVTYTDSTTDPANPPAPSTPTINP